ncbi:MAG: putative membrane protein [Flavobacteriales bacterium]|jgi:uncharacterized membrane protein
MTWIEYLRNGILHITDVNAYDHIVYLIALVCIFEYREVKRVVFIATAFTVGHSFTLILAGLNLIHIQSGWVEFLIPITILITSVTNLRYAKRWKTPVNGHGWRYLIAVFFGLIHGLGFSSYFRMIVDDADSIVEPLLFFNLGVEVGQLAVLVVFILLTFLFTGLLRIVQREWVIFLSGLTAGISILLAIETWPL